MAIIGRRKMGKIDLAKLKVGFQGKPFNQLVKHHLKRQNTRQLFEGALGTKAMLPASAQPLCEGFIDRWNERVYDREFWYLDTAEVSSNIVEDARSLLETAGVPTDDETLFNMFQIVVLSYAYSASDQPNMRKFIGI